METFTGLLIRGARVCVQVIRHIYESFNEPSDEYDHSSNVGDEDWISANDRQREELEDKLERALEKFEKEKRRLEDLENDYAPEYEVLFEQKNRVQEIKDYVREHEELLRERPQLEEEEFEMTLYRGRKISFLNSDEGISANDRQREELEAKERALEELEEEFKDHEPEIEEILAERRQLEEEEF